MIKSRYKIIVILILLAVLSGFFWSYNMFGKPITLNDDAQYNSLAKSIVLAGRYAKSEPNEPDWYTATEPFYPFFLAGIYKIFGLENFEAVRFIQLILFVITVLLVYFIASDLIEQKWAFFAGALTALFFPLAGMVGILLREPLVAFLLALFAFSIYRAQNYLKYKWFVLAGLSLGIAIFTNAIIEFFPLVVFFIFLGIFKKGFFRKDVLLKMGIFLILCYLPMAAWSSRSYFDESVVSSGVKSGYALGRRAEMMEKIKGNDYFKHLGGLTLGYYFFEDSGINPYELFIEKSLSARTAELLKMGYSTEETGKILGKENARIIIHNIPQYFAISVLDFLQFNGPMLPSPKNLAIGPMQNLFIKNSYPALPVWAKIIILLGLRIIFWILFALIIYGFIRAIKDWKKFIWVVSIVLYFNLVYSALSGMARYSIPIYPFYIILFALGISKVWEHFKLKKIETKEVK